MRFLSVVVILFTSVTIFSQFPQMVESSPSKGQLSNPVTVGLENIDELNVNIYSFGKKIFISVSDLSSRNSNISVYNITGKKVLSLSINDNITTINAADLKSGIYLVRTNIGGSQYQQKVFIK